MRAEQVVCLALCGRGTGVHWSCTFHVTLVSVPRDPLCPATVAHHGQLQVPQAKDHVWGHRRCVHWRIVGSVFAVVQQGGATRHVAGFRWHDSVGTPVAHEQRHAHGGCGVYPWCSSILTCVHGVPVLCAADFDGVTLVVNYTVEASTLDDYGETVHTKSRDHQQKCAPCPPPPPLLRAQCILACDTRSACGADTARCLSHGAGSGSRT